MSTRKTNYKPKGVGSPATAMAVSSLATSKAGQDTISGVGNVMKWGLIIGVVGVAGYVGYKVYSNRFVKMNQSRNHDKANISQGEAMTRANNLYNAMVGIGANYDIVKHQLLGVNYNGFVLIYNAFGKRESAGQKLNPFNVFSFGNKGMTLTEWLLNQFTSNNRLADLRAVLPGKFI